MESSGFYLDGKLFKPVIAEAVSLYDPMTHNACRLFVDISLSSPLDFTKVVQQAISVQSQGGLIVWDLYLDIKESLSELHFEGIFNAHYQALKLFIEHLWIPFQEKTLGCCLFQGSADVTSHFAWNEGHYQNFIEWLTDLYGTPSVLFEEPLGETPLGCVKHFNEFSLEMFEVIPFCHHLKNLYCINTLAAYLHRLAAALPEELFVFVDLDGRLIRNQAFLYQLISKERFSHLNLAIKGHEIPLESFKWNNNSLCYEVKEVRVGVCFPNDPFCVQSTLNALRKLFADLEKHQIAYRIIPEFLMTSSWDGLDEILFIHKALSPQGKRILQGFSITGGKCIYLDTPIGLDPECSFQEFVSLSQK